MLGLNIVHINVDECGEVRGVEVARNHGVEEVHGVEVHGVVVHGVVVHGEEVHGEVVHGDHVAAKDRDGVAEEDRGDVVVAAATLLLLVFPECEYLRSLRTTKLIPQAAQFL